MRAFLKRTLAGVTIALVAGVAFAQVTDANRSGHYNWNGPWGGWHMNPLMMIFWLVILVVVIFLLVRWIGGDRSSRAGPHQPAPGRTPLDILSERFAKGEIDKDEYEERRRVLGE